VSPDDRGTVERDRCIISRPGAGVKKKRKKPPAACVSPPGPWAGSGAGRAPGGILGTRGGCSSTKRPAGRCARGLGAASWPPEAGAGWGATSHPSLRCAAVLPRPRPARQRKTTPHSRSRTAGQFHPTSASRSAGSRRTAAGRRQADPAAIQKAKRPPVTGQAGRVGRAISSGVVGVWAGRITAPLSSQSAARIAAKTIGETEQPPRHLGLPVADGQAPGTCRTLMWPLPSGRTHTA